MAKLFSKTRKGEIILLVAAKHVQMPITEAIISEVLDKDAVKEQPPVLVDIGARGGVLSSWSTIANDSIAVAFDPNMDSSDLGVNSTEFLEKYVFDKAVVPPNWPAYNTIYITDFPACSSLLHPNVENVGNYTFGPLFDVKSTEDVESITLTEALDDLDLDYIDWFKADSQGLDWRLFTSLSDDIINNVTIAEFEPGLIESYRGEDNLSDILAGMESHGFWPFKCDIFGPPRIHRSLLSHHVSSHLAEVLKTDNSATACWAEIGFMSDYQAIHSKRDALIGWLFATIADQHPFALEIGLRSERNYEDSIFPRLKSYSKKAIYKSLLLRAVKNPKATVNHLIGRLNGW